MLAGYEPTLPAIAMLRRSVQQVLQEAWANNQSIGGHYLDEWLSQHNTTPDQFIEGTAGIEQRCGTSLDFLVANSILALPTWLVTADGQVVAATSNSAPEIIVLHVDFHFKLIHNPFMHSEVQLPSSRHHPLPQPLPPTYGRLHSHIERAQPFQETLACTHYHQTYNQVHDSHLVSMFAVPAFVHAATLSHPHATLNVTINQSSHTAALPTWCSFAYNHTLIRTATLPQHHAPSPTTDNLIEWSKLHATQQLKQFAREIFTTHEKSSPQMDAIIKIVRKFIHEDPASVREFLFHLPFNTNYHDDFQTIPQYIKRMVQSQFVYGIHYILEEDLDHLGQQTQPPCVILPAEVHTTLIPVITQVFDCEAFQCSPPSAPPLDQPQPPSQDIIISATLPFNSPPTQHTHQILSGGARARTRPVAPHIPSELVEVVLWTSREQDEPHACLLILPDNNSTLQSMCDSACQHIGAHMQPHSKPFLWQQINHQRTPVYIPFHTSARYVRYFHIDVTLEPQTQPHTSQPPPPTNHLYTPPPPASTRRTSTTSSRHRQQPGLSRGHRSTHTVQQHHQHQAHLVTGGTNRRRTQDVSNPGDDHSQSSGSPGLVGFEHIHQAGLNLVPAAHRLTTHVTRHLRGSARWRVLPDASYHGFIVHTRDDATIRQ
eukprot:6473753-Amphidinium_carterae.1